LLVVVAFTSASGCLPSRSEQLLKATPLDRIMADPAAYDGM